MKSYRPLIITILSFFLFPNRKNKKIRKYMILQIIQNFDIFYIYGILEHISFHFRKNYFKNF